MWPYFPELFAQPAPRYTSYPTAAEFRDDVGVAEWNTAVDAIAADTPLSLYVHIPFCQEICWYCGCNTGAANRTDRLGAYMEALEQEIDRVADRLGGRGVVRQIAFGGGSPNSIEPLGFIRLLDRLLTRFAATDAQISVELDPRGLDRKWHRALAGTGVSRISLGVQTFAPHVQKLINRVQPYEMIADQVHQFRAGGITSINFDLMYGLPGQSLDDLSETIDRAVGLGPDRIAAFGYAHLPDLIPRQRKISSEQLPDQQLRFDQAQLAYLKLVGEGYRALGIDHFARPHDPLAHAVAEGRLHRNFQGYTDDDATVLLGFGASAISSFPGLLAQNEKNAGRYRMRVSGGAAPVMRGIRRNNEDRLRGAVIEDLLCTGHADVGARSLEYLGDAAALDQCLSRLEPFQRHDLVTCEGRTVRLEDHARPYARVVAQVFDSYRAVSTGQFSRAI